ncbi:MAG: DUF4838 domain-containing protein [Planctomycetes bacterium]|nr:DUF4838 domain-containing protein [Planctomycetota bacterium]
MTVAAITAGDRAIDRITHAHDAPVPVRFAAGELARYLHNTLGATLPVVTGDAAPGAFYITTTDAPPRAKELARFTPGQSDRASVVLRDGVVWVIGENPRSALFAVYDLLQHALGVRFFAPGEEHELTPRRERWEVPPGFEHHTGSAVAIRDFVGYGGDAFDSAIKNRVNCIGLTETTTQDYDLARTRGVLVRGPGHVMRLLVPDESLFVAHPEYFPLVNGERRPNGRTACFSNPDVRRIFGEKLTAYLRARPPFDIFSIWNEDNPDPFYCVCERCAVMPITEWYLTLVNDAAEIVDREWPDTIFEFIAYHGTRNPPTRPHRFYRDGEKMLIDYCLGYTRDIYAPLAERSGGSAEVHAQFDGWERFLNQAGYRGKRLLMEYYNTCELPNQGPRGRAMLWPMETIRTDTLYYMGLGLDGLSDWTCINRYSFPTPFAIWCWLRLYTDPHRSIESYKDEFYTSYFGDAGGAVRGYIDALEIAMHERTSEANIERVRALSVMLDGIPAPTDAALARRINILKIHHDYCVLVKRIFLAFLNGDEPAWRALEQPHRDFFVKTHSEALKGEVDRPLPWSDLWFDHYAKAGNLGMLTKNPWIH